MSKLVERLRVCIILRPNVFEIVSRKLIGGKVCRFVAPGYVTQRKLHVGQRYAASLINFWRIGKKHEAESCDGVAEANAEV